MAAGAVAGAAYRRRAGGGTSGPESVDDDQRSLGWGADFTRPDHRTVRTPDGAQLAVWDVEGDGPDAPVVVLPHCWGCSHEIWLPVARRLREQGHRVVLYDQRGHGASTRGTAPLAIETLAHDLAHVLEAQDVQRRRAGRALHGRHDDHVPGDVPARGHEGAGPGDRAGGHVGPRPPGRSFPQAARIASAFVASPIVTRSMRSTNGHRFVRGAFGADPVHSHVVLTRDLFAGCDPSVRGGWLAAITEMNLLEGIAGDGGADHGDGRDP